MEKKYTNVSKYATQTEATRAYEAYCKEKGIPCTRQGFNAWCWETAPECQEFRPFTFDEAKHLLGTEFRKKDGQGYFVATEILVKDGEVTLNSFTVKELLADWVLAGFGHRAGVLVS